jgi:rod shape-determining protein MreB
VRFRSKSIRVGSDEFDEAIAAHVRREHRLAIGTGTAEEIKLELGSAGPLPDEIEAEIRGRDLVSGLPKTVLLRSEDVRQAMEEPVAAIVEAVKTTLEQTPPELAADVMDQGIMLAGGGCMLRGFDARLRAETELPVHLAESPLTCVAVGAGRSLEELSAMSRAASSPPRHRRRR